MLRGSVVQTVKCLRLAARLQVGINHNKSGSASRILRNFSSSYNDEEVSKFGKVKDWWDPNGSQRGLHAYNPLRIDFLRKHILTYANPSNAFRFLKGKKVL